MLVYQRVTILFNQEAQYLAAFAGRGPRGCGRKSMMVSFSWGKKCWSSATHLTKFKKKGGSQQSRVQNDLPCIYIHIEVVWWVATGWYQRRKRRCKSDVSWFILRMWEHNRFSTNTSKLHKYLTQWLNPNETSANHKHCGRLIIQGLDVVVPYQTSRGRMLHHPEGFKR